VLTGYLERVLENLEQTRSGGMSGAPGINA
jgi:hypothetical protein